ncbi:MAG: lysylphosphatidylglycerol synthase transmembrane domain-containing protein [Vicinamibacterales bacterium]
MPLQHVSTETAGVEDGARGGRRFSALKRTALKRTAIVAGKWALVAAALWYLLALARLRVADLAVTWQGLPFLSCGAGLTLLAMLLGFYRHWLLLRGIGIPIPLAEAFKAGAIGAFFNSFLLGGVGGDVVKLAYLMRQHSQRARILASVMVDRVVGLLGLFVVAGVAMGWHWKDMDGSPESQRLALLIFSVVGGLALGLVVCAVSMLVNRMWAALAWCVGSATAVIWALLAKRWLAGQDHTTVFCVLGGIALALLGLVLAPSDGRVAFVPRRIIIRSALGRRILALADSLLQYRNHPGAVIAAFGISVALQGIGVYSLFVLALGLPIEPKPRVAEVFQAGPPALVCNSVPVPGGGLGVGEATFDSLLRIGRDGSTGKPSGGAAVFLTLRVLTVLLGLMGLPCFLAWKVPVSSLRQMGESDGEQTADETNALRRAA